MMYVYLHDRVFNSVDITVEILSYIHPSAVFPIALTCKRLRDGVVRQLGLNNNCILSNAKHLVLSVELVKWVMMMGCKSPHLMEYAAEGGYLDVMKMLRIEHCSTCRWSEGVCASAALGGI